MTAPFKDWGTWSTNYVRNRRRWAPTDDRLAMRSASRLDGRFFNWWAVSIIVGAGPSLDRSLPDLLYLNRIGRNGRPGDSFPRGHRAAIVFATDAALKPLLHYGIKPDFVVALDEHNATYRFYEGLNEDGMELIGSVTMLTEAIEAFLGPKGSRNKVWFYANANPNVYEVRSEMGFRREEHKALPWIQGWTNSVSMMAAVIAQRMGIRDHFLVGCDYSVEGDRTHCDNFAVSEKDIGIQRSDYVERVTTAMRSHVDRIHAIKGREKLPIYNCSAGGALRWNNVPLLEAARQWSFMRGMENGSYCKLEHLRLEQTLF